MILTIYNKKRSLLIFFFYVFPLSRSQMSFTIFIINFIIIDYFIINFDQVICAIVIITTMTITAYQTSLQFSPVVNFFYFIIFQKLMLSESFQHPTITIITNFKDGDTIIIYELVFLLLVHYQHQRIIKLFVRAFSFYLLSVKQFSLFINTQHYIKIEI